MMWYTKSSRVPVTWSWYWIENCRKREYYPAIDIAKSGTRREDLLLSQDEQEAVYIMRKALNGMKADEAVENILNMFTKTRNNQELVNQVKNQKFI